jgi:hypothetical protein
MAGEVERATQTLAATPQMHLPGHRQILKFKSIALTGAVCVTSRSDEDKNA